MADNKPLKTIKEKTSAIRLRTWTLTLAILITLVFYFLVQVSMKQAINPVDFVFLCIVQIVTHCIYFPDGELSGQRTPAFVDNKRAYNEKASEINQEKRIAKLREYCKVEYKERKQMYVLNECGALDITLGELNILKHLSPKELKRLKSYEFKYETIVNGEKEEESKLVFFTKAKRKRLCNLVFKELPVEPNHPETIMSAVENNGTKAIQDTSITYRKHAYERKIFQAVVIGGIFAYIGYTLRDGIGIAEIVRILMYVTSLFSTAVLSFSSGETCSKVYKSHFYVDLVNFIDGFNEWIGTHNIIDDKLIKEGA